MNATKMQGAMQGTSNSFLPIKGKPRWNRIAARLREDDSYQSEKDFYKKYLHFKVETVWRRLKEIDFDKKMLPLISLKIAAALNTSIEDLWEVSIEVQSTKSVREGKPSWVSIEGNPTWNRMAVFGKKSPYNEKQVFERLPTYPSLKPHSQQAWFYKKKEKDFQSAIHPFNMVRIALLLNCKVSDIWKL